MGTKILENIKLVRESEAYIDGLYAVLNGAGLFDGQKHMLYGMTGMAFKFICHKKIISPSRYLYHMERDSWKALDRLGIYNEVYCGMRDNPTFYLYQQKAVERIKESIDRGVGALFWEPIGIKFNVIYGYDDEDRVFYYRDRAKSGFQVLMYDNVGRISTAFWVCQVIGDKADKDIRDIYMDSIEGAVDEWENYDNVPDLAKDELRSGRQAYDFMINALQGDFNETGTLVTIREAILSKKSISLYLDEVVKEYPMLCDANEKYRYLYSIYREIDAILNKMYDGHKLIERCYVPELAESVKCAKEAEEGAVSCLKDFLAETLYNRRIDYYDVKKFI